MNIPFTKEQFLDVFAHYNLTVWPFQIVLYLLAITVIIVSLKKFKNSDKTGASVLSFLWIWTGLVYHMLFFSTINNAAIVFAVLFIVQGMLFFISGLKKQQLSFVFKADLYGVSGMVFIIYALIIYPLLGYFLGHVYPWSPTFGLPCPTTIFTFGILLMADKKIPFYILIIPFIWSLIGFSAAVNLHIYEDFGLVIAGIAGSLLILIRQKNFRQGSLNLN
jgi:Family of unknown function (DUF6064)